MVRFGLPVAWTSLAMQACLASPAPNLSKVLMVYLHTFLTGYSQGKHDRRCVVNCFMFLFPPGMAGGKYRSFLVHIKAVSDKGIEETSRPVVRMPSARPQGTKAHSLSTLLQRAQASKV